MRQKFAALQCGFAAFHGLDESILFFEIARDYVLHNFIRLDALLCRTLREASLQIGAELNVHALKIRKMPCPCNPSTATILYLS
jgi:hypothetical protein